MSEEIKEAEVVEDKTPVEEFKKPEDIDPAQECLKELNALLDKWQCNLAVGMIVNAQGNQPLLNVVKRPETGKVL